MPLDASVRPLRITDPELRLPPPFSLVRLRELGDAFAHARAIAAEAGAGTLVHVGRFDLAEFALVLEPEEPLATARRAFIAGMAALADALSAHAQPETLIEIHWPGALTVNLGLVGGGRLAWPDGTNEDDVPDWLVFGGMIRTESMQHEPGLTPNVTALAEEGFGETSAADIVESFARNMMMHLDVWQEKGFGAVAKSYLERLSGEGLRSLADNGDLLRRRPREKENERETLLAALAHDDWYDPATKGPRA
ncbi:MAG: biotin/lipoate--protein ligase family protein [Pseudolabrys sp.]